MSIHLGGIPVLAVALVAEAAAAQIPEPWWQSIAQTGALGGMLLWFMFIQTRQQRQTIDAVNLLSRAISALIMHSKHQDAALNDLATEINKEAEEALKKK